MAAETITLNFRIIETIKYIGSVSVDAEHLKAYLATNGIDALTQEDLQEYMAQHNLDNTEDDGDVQGQVWDRFCTDDSSAASVLGVRLVAG